MLNILRVLILVALIPGCKAGNFTGLPVEGFVGLAAEEAGRADLSVIQKEASDLNKRLGNITLDQANNIRERYTWVQPENIKVNCKVFISKNLSKFVLLDSINLHWDGDCREGYASGLGREFVSGKLQNGSTIDLYFLSDYYGEKGSMPARYIERDFANNITKEGNLFGGYYLKNVFVKSRPSTYAASPSLKRFFQIDPEYVGNLHLGFMDESGKSKITKIENFVNISREIRDVEGLGLEIVRAISDSRSLKEYSAATYLSPRLPISNLYEIRRNRPKMRLFLASRRTVEVGSIFERVVVSTFYKGKGEEERRGKEIPEVYFNELDQIELGIVKASEIAFVERLISLKMKKLYVRLTCNNSGQDASTLGERYKEICHSEEKDNKVTALIFLIDAIRKNKDVLVKYFVAEQSGRSISEAEDAKLQLIIPSVFDPTQIDSQKNLASPEMRQRYLKHVRSKLREFISETETSRADSIEPGRGVFQFISQQANIRGRVGG